MAFVFLLGGARSGKSSLAVRYAAAADQAGSGITFVVTAEGLDDEMRERITKHREERPPSWCAVEAPRSLENAISQVPADHCLVVDCVSMWVANLVMDGETDVERRAETLAATLRARSAPTYVVSNEVGMGLVPEHELGRQFRDVLGRVNAALAADAAEAYLVVAGRTLRLLEPPV